MAFITGEFNDDGLLTDDTTELTNSQAKSINDWIKFYHDKYVFKGELKKKKKEEFYSNLFFFFSLLLLIRYIVKNCLNLLFFFQGKLIGRYYDQDGNPTDEFYKFENKVKKAENDKTIDEIDKKIFPPCNIEWIPEEGTKVWCTKMR